MAFETERGWNDGILDGRASCCHGGDAGAARCASRPSAVWVSAIPAALQVTRSTPHTSLVAADDDPTVNAVENAGRFFTALRAAKVPSELHI